MDHDVTIALIALVSTLITAAATIIVAVLYARVKGHEGRLAKLELALGAAIPHIVELRRHINRGDPPPPPTPPASVVPYLLRLED